MKRQHSSGSPDRDGGQATGRISPPSSEAGLPSQRQQHRGDGDANGPPPAQRPKLEHGNDSEEQEEPGGFYLKHQNKALAVELLQYRRTIADLERRLATTQRSQRRCEATLSVVNRAWHALDDDLATAARVAQLPLPPPVHINGVRPNASAEAAHAAGGGSSGAPSGAPSDVSGGGSAGGASSTDGAPAAPPGADGGGSLMRDLLAVLEEAAAVDASNPAAPLPLLNGSLDGGGGGSSFDGAVAVNDGGDATAVAAAGSSGGSRGAGKAKAAAAAAAAVPPKDDNTSKDPPDYLVDEWARRDELMAPLDDYGLGGASSSPSSLAPPPPPGATAAKEEEGAVGEKVAEAALQEKAALTQRVFTIVLNGLARYVGMASDDAQKVTLDRMHGQLLADRRRMAAAAAVLRDQLRAALRRCSDLQEELHVIKHQQHRARRKLDLLVAEGVAIPKDNFVSTAGAPSSASLGAAGGTAGAGGGADGTAQQTANGGGYGASAAVTAEVPEPSDEAEAALAEAAEKAVLAESRLVEANQLRAEKLELERRLGRALASRGLSSEDVHKHPEMLKRDIDLQVERDSLAREKQRSGDLERRARDAEAQVYLLQEQHAEEIAATREAYEARVTQLRGGLRDTMAESEATTRQRDRAQLEVAELKQWREQAETHREAARAFKEKAEDNARRRTEIENTQGALQQCRAELAAAEQRLTLALERGGGPGDHRGQVDRLQREIADLRKTNDGKDEFNRQLMNEIDTVTEDLAKKAEELERVQAAAAAADVEHRRLMADMVKLRNKCDDLVRSDGSKAHSLAVQKDTMESQQRLVAGQAEKLAELEKALRLESDEGLELKARLVRETESTDRARKEALALKTDLTQLRAVHEGLLQQFDGLKEQASAARAAESRASEQAASQVKALDRATAKIERYKKKEEARSKALAGGEGLNAEDTAVLEEENKALKKQLKCSVCLDRQKNVVLTKCYHMFCEECIKENLRNRTRKCPACSRGFGDNDFQHIFLT